MVDLKDVSLRKLSGPILKSVSRSFYISVRLLPKKLREPVGLAYLLARATDTLADTTEVPTALRKEKIGNLAADIQGNGATYGIAQKFALLQKNEAERTLIQSIPQCLEHL